MVQSENKEKINNKDFKDKKAQELADEMDEDAPEKKDPEDPDNLLSEEKVPVKGEKMQTEVEKTPTKGQIIAKANQN